MSALTVTLGADITALKRAMARGAPQGCLRHQDTHGYRPGCLRHRSGGWGSWLALRFLGPFEEFLFEEFFRRQVEFVFAGVDVRFFGQGEFDDGVFFRLAEKQADSRGFVGQFHLPVEVIHIHLHLAEVLMGQFVEFEIDDDLMIKQK